MALQEHAKTNPKLVVTMVVVLLIVVGYVIWSKSRGGSLNVFGPSEEGLLSNDIPVGTVKVDDLLRRDVQKLQGEVGDQSAQQVKGVATNLNLPLAPEDIEALDPKTGRLLNVFWSAPRSGEVATYRVYRSTSEGVLGSLVSGDVRQTVFQDREVQNGVVYFYTVHAVNAQGDESRNTRQVSAIPTDVQAPSSPSKVTVMDAKEGGVLNVSWVNPPDSDFVGVNIYRSEVEGELGTQIKTVLGNTASLRDENVVDGQFYYYTVTAVDSEGNESATALARVASGRSNPFIPSGESNE